MGSAESYPLRSPPGTRPRTATRRAPCPSRSRSPVPSASARSARPPAPRDAVRPTAASGASPCPPALPTRLPSRPPPPTSSLGRDERPLVAAPPSPPLSIASRAPLADARLTSLSSSSPASPVRSAPAFVPRASNGDTPPVADADAPAPAKESRFKRRDPSAAAPRPSPLGAGPDANPARSSGIKVIPVEQRPADAFQGVAKVDPDEDPGTRVAKLVAGDVAAILVFAAIGRGNHGEGMFVGDVFATALPFLIGWFAVSPVAGTFGEDARVRRFFRRRERSEIVPLPPFVARSRPFRRARPSLSTHVPLRLCSRRERRWAPRRRRRRRGGPPAFLSVSRFAASGRARSRRNRSSSSPWSPRARFSSGGGRGSPRAGRTREETSREILWSS